MSRRVSALSMLAFALLAAPSVLAQKTLTATEAKAHIGEQSTVCGKVVRTKPRCQVALRRSLSTNATILMVPS